MLWLNPFANAALGDPVLGDCGGFLLGLGCRSVDCGITFTFGRFTTGQQHAIKCAEFEAIAK